MGILCVCQLNCVKSTSFAITSILTERVNVMYKVLRFGKFNRKEDGKEFRIMDVLDCSSNSIIIDEFVDKDFKANDIVEPILVVNRAHKLQVRGWNLVKSASL